MDQRNDHAATRTIADACSDLATFKLDSCHSTWYFQPARMRFRRVLKGLGLSGVATGWRPYYGLRFDDSFDIFTVKLDREGTRTVRARCHGAEQHQCEHCASDHDEEPVLDGGGGLEQ